MIACSLLLSLSLSVVRSLFFIRTRAAATMRMMRCCVGGLLWLIVLVLLSQRAEASPACVPLPEMLLSQCQVCVSLCDSLGCVCARP